MKDVATIPGYYTIYEAAEVIGVTHSQVARYIRNGELPASVVGNAKLLEQEVVHKFRRKPVGNPQFRKHAKGAGKN